MIGLKILYNFSENPKNPNEFINGEVVDPANGNIYKGKIKINSTGRKMTLRGYIGSSVFGRSQIWIKVD
ncbi:DUF2147 domain-containing protein [Acinetobacter guillouiae]|uniref:DUF2147 domain-containing protein n=1 Tax=Acinetobacter guillouiae TaxID=106649 RepID=UPI001CD32183|nr:DUF2147 domain-containing protein [Acinetobacter guillouiae]